MHLAWKKCTLKKLQVGERIIGIAVRLKSEWTAKLVSETPEYPNQQKQVGCSKYKIKNACTGLQLNIWLHARWLSHVCLNPKHYRVVVDLQCLHLWGINQSKCSFLLVISNVCTWILEYVNWESTVVSVSNEMLEIWPTILLFSPCWVH